MTLIQEQLAKIGIGVELFPGDQAAQDEARLSSDTIQVYHSMVGRADYDVLKSQYSGDNRNSLLNYDTSDESYGDQELQDLLDEVASEPTEEGRAQASADVQQRMADEAYILPLFEEPQVFAFRRRVRGFATEPVGRPDFYSTWIAS